MKVPPILWTLGLAAGVIAVVLLLAASIKHDLQNWRDRRTRTAGEGNQVKVRRRLWAMGLLGGLLGWAIGLAPPRRTSRPDSPRTLWALGLVTALIAVVLLLAAWTKAELRARRLAPIRAALEQDLGFRLGTRFTPAPAEGRGVFRRYLEGEKVMMIMEVAPGKPMAEAGIEAGDVITGDTRDFINDLQESRGASFAISVVRNGSSMQLVVSVPP